MGIKDRRRKRVRSCGRLEELDDVIDRFVELWKAWAKDGNSDWWSDRLHWTGVLWEPWVEDWKNTAEETCTDIDSFRSPSSRDSWVILEDREWIDFKSGNYNSDLWSEDIREYAYLLAELFILWENSPTLYWMLFDYADA